MIQISWVYLVFACFLASFLSAYFTRRSMKKEFKDTVGTLFIDPLEPEDRGGVYAAFDADPKEFTDGDIVSMAVKIVRK